MIDLQDFAIGSEDIEKVLNKYGLTIGFYANYVNQARKNIRFLRMMELINDEEAQTIFQRLIAKMAGWIDEQS